MSEKQTDYTNTSKKRLTLLEMKKMNESIQEQENEKDLPNKQKQDDLEIIKSIIEPSAQISLTQSDKIRQLEAKWGLQVDNLNERKALESEQDAKQIQIKQNEQKFAQLLEERNNVKLSKFSQLQKQIGEKEIKDLKLQSKGELNKNEEYPIQYAYFMEERSDMAPKYNVGSKWGEVVEKQVDLHLKHRTDVAQNYLWAMTKKGRLGVDLFAIGFGLVGIALLPTYFYFRQKKKVAVYKEEYKQISSIKDLHNTELDLDDISMHNTNYNLFSKEIKEEKDKQVKRHEEINRLIKTVYANK